MHIDRIKNALYQILILLYSSKTILVNHVVFVMENVLNSAMAVKILENTLKNATSNIITIQKKNEFLRLLSSKILFKSVVNVLRTLLTRSYSLVLL